MNILIPNSAMSTITLSEKKIVEKLILGFREKHLDFGPLCRIFSDTSSIEPKSVSYEISRYYKLDGYYFPTSKDFDIWVSVNVIEGEQKISDLCFFLSDYINYVTGKEMSVDFLDHVFIHDYRKVV